MLSKQRLDEIRERFEYNERRGVMTLAKQDISDLLSYVEELERELAQVKAEEEAK